MTTGKRFGGVLGFLGLGLGLGLSATAALAAMAEPVIMVSAGAVAPETPPAAPRHGEIHREIRALPAMDGALAGEGLMIVDGPFSGPHPFASEPPASAPECVLRYLRPGLSDYQSDLVVAACEAWLPPKGE
jgi:hypothetical protein